VIRHLAPCLGGRPVAALTADDCRGYRLALEAKRLAPQTVAHVLSDLRAMLLWAEGDGLVDRSPFPRRILPRIQERAPDRLTEEECAKLVTMPEPWGFYLRLLLGTGIRWGEATRAQASHCERGVLVVAVTKSGRVRRIPLPPGLLGEIQGRVGRLVAYTHGAYFARKVRRLSGATRFRIHMTRHTYACRWLERGGSITALQEILGHRSVTTTQRYGRPNEEAIRREAERSWTA
jgi:integrase